MKQRARKDDNGRERKEYERVSESSGRREPVEEDSSPYEARNDEILDVKPVFVEDRGRARDEKDRQAGAQPRRDPQVLTKRQKPCREDKSHREEDDAEGPTRIIPPQFYDHPEEEVVEGRLAVEVPETLEQVVSQERNIDVLPVGAQRAGVEAHASCVVARARQAKRQEYCEQRALRSQLRARVRYRRFGCIQPRRGGLVSHRCALSCSTQRHSARTWNR